jgi:stearoyl-CoA desaturase (delta-9 desaturase)
MGASETMDGQQQQKRAEKDWGNIAFLTLTPILGIPVTALYTWYAGFELWMAVLFVSMYLLVGFSITAGYHRFFTHRSHDCSPWIQSLYAFFGAMAAQNSILWWSSSHRTHHSYVDRDWDPYNIKRGFWWAHIFWIFYKNPREDPFENAKDLINNPIVRWQHRWHKAILILGGFGIPTLIGALFGDPVAGLLWGGFLRVVVIHHTTFFVNSLAHHLGERTYNPDESARDNWLVALVTLGEGYHSFHHRFPADFRNGVRWYHWDPAKWWIATMKLVGLADSLRVTAAPLIEQARLHAATMKVEKHQQHLSATVRHEIESRIQRARHAIERAIVMWRQHSQGGSRSRVLRKISRRKLRQARRERLQALRMLQRSLRASA